LTYRGQRSWNLWAACLGFLCGLVLMSAEIPAGIAVAQTVTPQDKAHAIDPFTAAASGGNVFVGPTLPFGMAKPGPDMNIGENDANAGWAATGEIRGFSQTHVSGTGGGAKYGNMGRAWLRHRELVDGGELILMMAARPSHWGADEEPPSSLAKP
jgi:putative alpha-1,2-mannosidase